jgi:hypothetical protein
MRKYALLLGAVFAALLAIIPATASASSTGYLEICKHSDTTNPVSGNFSFTVNGTTTVTVPVGGCSADIAVPAGNNTVVEASNAFTAETATDTIPQADLVSSDLSTRTDVVKVPAGDISTAVSVEYTNKELFGTMEVCKSAQAGSGLTGSFTFDIAGPMGFDKTVSVPVGACSNSLRVPAGVNEVDEIGTNNTDVVAESTIPANDLVTDNLAAGTSRVNVAAGTDVNNETIVTFVNSTSRLKICKVAGTAALAGTVFSFTANGQTVQAVAQAAPGGCVLVPTPFPGGTRVDIAEAISPGTAVSAIDVSGGRAIAGTTDLANRKVSVTLGSGQTVVTYTDVAASPGLLKVCKNAGAGVTLGQVFHFTVGSTAVDVPAGFCALAGTFAFNSTQTVTEAATAGLSVIAEAADPAAELVSTDLANRTEKVMIGAGVTEVAFTNATTGTTATTSTGSGTGATTTSPTTVPTTTSSLPVVTPTPVVSTPPSTVRRGHRACTVIARIVSAPLAGLGRRINGVTVSASPVLVLSLRGNLSVCSVLLREFNVRGAVIAHRSLRLHRGHAVQVALPRKVARVAATVVR